MYVHLYIYTRVYIFPFLLDIYNFMSGDGFLLKVEQFLDRLVQWSTAAIAMEIYDDNHRIKKKMIYVIDDFRFSVPLMKRK